ncbi:uncharacterized protein LOC143885298 [Tasmannia lanceolata]|uniref:uncharacterized protein LOC143885298 n=1 Tax=Tasmannia lanceolata TaxID=3420 RepID=UPI0040647C33
MQSGYGIPEIQQFMVDSLLPISQQNEQNQRFHHIQPFPITQQFFQNQNHFQTFEEHTRRLNYQLGLDKESGLENSNSASQISGAPRFIMTNFKLGVNENSGSGEGLVDEETMIRGEDSAIKEPFWKPLEKEYINRNNKRCEEKIETSSKYSKNPDEDNENEEEKNSGSNYGLFSELEAIYTSTNGGGCGNKQAGSRSALTGDNNLAPTTVPELGTSTEASLKKLQNKRRKRRKKELSSIAMFFHNLVKKLMNHQENLHMKFLEVMERRDEERTNREEEWRKQEAANLDSEAISRAQEQAVASSLEAAIVSFLEKITSQTINLPNKDQFEFTLQFLEETQKEKGLECWDAKFDNKMDKINTRRWPKAEVQALIRVRSGLESKYQEPGLKGPLWEEVSSSMASMGYQRSSKRCKEKWENINKYFRKTKDSAKKRPQHSKTCPYFHQLDQLHSKSHALSLPTAVIEQPKDNSELLDAIVVPVDQNPSLTFIEEELEILRTFKFPEMGPLRSNYEVNDDIAPKKVQDHGNEEEEEDEEENKGGEGQNQENLENQVHEREHKEEYHGQPMFFRLES